MTLQAFEGLFPTFPLWHELSFPLGSPCHSIAGSHISHYSNPQLYMEWVNEVRPCATWRCERHTCDLFDFVGKQQKQSKANSRKSKSPNLGQAYSGGERPSSVSSVHSEGDYHRQAQAQPQWNWEDRPSSTGQLFCHCHRRIFLLK